MAEKPPSWFEMVAALVRRPDLYRVAVRQGGRLVPNRWWTHRPFLPVPPREYLRFRVMTAAGGDGSGPPAAADVVSYLEWCRTQP